MIRSIGVVTTSRADYGHYLPVLRAIEADPDLELHLIVTGMHLSPAFGMTVKTIEADGFSIEERIEVMLSSDTPAGIGKTMGMGVSAFAQLFSRFHPDMLMVLGDRFEMAAAPLAALPYKIPVAHLHGGEVTQGAIDDSLRHTITKLSHLHFVATDVYAKRVIQLGEEPWRVTVSGAPGLDNLKNIDLLDRTALSDELGLSLDAAPLLITYHPVTLEYENTDYQIDELLAALDSAGMPVIFTLPNADTAGQVILKKIKEYTLTHADTYMRDNLGTERYFSLMACAAAMVGNSSSGLIEAASFRLPVVNIGTRQTGRVHPANVIDTGYSRDEILRAIQQAVSADFRATLVNLVNPYGDGHAAERIINRLKNITLDDKLITKAFYDIDY